MCTILFLFLQILMNAVKVPRVVLINIVGMLLGIMNVFAIVDSDGMVMLVQVLAIATG